MKPFVDPPPREPLAWLYCDHCGEPYDASTEHACDPLSAARGILLAVGAVVVIYAVLALAALAWWPL